MFLIHHLSFIFSTIDNQLISAERIYKTITLTRGIINFANDFIAVNIPKGYKITHENTDEDVNPYHVKLKSLLSEIVKFNAQIPDIKYAQTLKNTTYFINIMNKARGCRKEISRVTRERSLSKKETDSFYLESVLYLKSVQMGIKEFLKKIKIKRNVVCANGSSPDVLLKELYDHLKSTPRYYARSCCPTTKLSKSLQMVSDFAEEISQFFANKNFSNDLKPVLKHSQLEKLKINLEALQNKFSSALASFLVRGYLSGKYKLYEDENEQYVQYASLISSMNLMLIASNNILNAKYFPGAIGRAEILDFEECTQGKNILEQVLSKITEADVFLKENLTHARLVDNNYINTYHKQQKGLLCLIHGFLKFYDHMLLRKNELIHFNSAETDEIELHLELLYAHFLSWGNNLNLIFHLFTNTSSKAFRKYLSLKNGLMKYRIELYHLIPKILTD